jgi:hypothetical protein
MPHFHQFFKAPPLSSQPKAGIIPFEERMERAAIIQAIAQVAVDQTQARQWFLDLETHPQRYQFETHEGFAFTEGNFGQVGARFQTWERFLGIQVNLHFELTETSNAYFQMRLCRPPLPIWCTFYIEKNGDHATTLSLRVGGTSFIGRLFLSLPIAKHVIQKQIQGEINHIKTSMETISNSTNS